MTDQSRATRSLKQIESTPALPTFMDHVRELQGRLFSIAIVFLIVACAAYPLFDHIVNFLVAPLGDDHELVYLTPGGAFGFIIKVCMYVGVIGALPIIVYHVYRFLLPAVKVVNIRRALLYTVVSLFLALIGLTFAYFLSLPAALYFLTSFNLNNINPMLTIDSYFSFVMTYLLAGALLFQLPLIITIINIVKPLTPGGMMKYQRHLIVGSFVMAAVISPTPDVLNQTILALPVVIMYQASIVAVWISNRKVTYVAKERPNVTYKPLGKLALQRTFSMSRPALSTVGPRSHRTAQRVVGPAGGMYSQNGKSVDGFTRARPLSMSESQRHSRNITRAVRAQPTSVQSPARPLATRGIDGFMMPTRQMQ